MKKLITFSLIVTIVGLMSNCSPKTAKKVAKTETKEVAKGKSAAATNAATPTQDVVQHAQGGRTNEEQVTMLSQTNAARVDHGKQLYESTCNKCHELHKPGSRTAAGWVEIMKTMGPKAKIEQGPYMMISAYLVKNAKG